VKASAVKREGQSACEGNLGIRLFLYASRSHPPCGTPATEPVMQKWYDYLIEHAKNAHRHVCIMHEGRCNDVGGEDTRSKVNASGWRGAFWRGKQYLTLATLPDAQESRSMNSSQAQPDQPIFAFKTSRTAQIKPQRGQILAK
jgi:hypothetical protein